MFKKVEGIQKQFTTKVEELHVGQYSLVTKGRLAEGGFGLVDLVTDVHTKAEYVLKRCSVQNNQAMEVVKKEIYLLQLFSCPNIVQILGTEFVAAKNNSREALILLEFCPGGHLLDRLQKREGKIIPDKMRFRFFAQLLNAVQCLHNNVPYIVHRDLKLENILIAADGSLRLCDFGSCVFGPVSIRTNVERSEAESVINKETTPIYRAPELIDLHMREELTEKTDIWALGCIFYAMCYLKLPFQEGATLAVLSDKISYPRVEGVSEDSYVLLRRMLDFDAEARPTVSDLLAACNSIEQDQPLPQYELTAEARQRRAAREAAAHKSPVVKVVKKPTGPVMPARSTVPAGTSSAAAKRLAAMKGTASAPEVTVFDAPAFEAPSFDAPAFPERSHSSSPIRSQSPQTFEPQNQGLPSGGSGFFEEFAPAPVNATASGFDFDAFSAPASIAASSQFADDGFGQISAPQSAPVGSDFMDFFDSGFSSAPPSTPSAPMTSSPIRTRPTSMPSMESYTTALAAPPTKPRPVSNPVGSKPMPVGDMDFLNMDAGAVASLGTDVGSLLDMPMQPNKSSEVMSLFDNATPDPFGNKAPPKPPKPAVMRPPNMQAVNISGIIYSSPPSSSLDNLKFI